MLRSTTDLWRAALFVSLGLVETGCSPNPGMASSEPEIGNALTSTGDDTSHPNDTPGGDFQCTADEPYILGGFDTGRMRCFEGAEHRASEATCPLPDFLELPADAGAPVGRCKSDADCGEGSVCNCEVTPSIDFADGVAVDGFNYGGGVCVQASCRTDADCGGGALCVLAAKHAQTADGCPATVGVFVCQTVDDECDSREDCGSGLCLSEGGRLQCGTYGSVCGRPFLIDGVPRVAELTVHGGWSDVSEAPVIVERCGRLIARHWQEMALAEHASVAAFARFTLQLLHLGAPLPLIEKSQRAMCDETEHAKICFSLAARYGAPLGPGALSIDAALREQSLPSIVRLTFREGCIGETVAALEAAAALAGASDQKVCAALSRIAEDERSHADLAWVFVAWALRENRSGEVLSVLRQELKRVQAELSLKRLTLEDVAKQTETQALGRHGVLSAATRAEVRRAALCDIVVPCAARLVDVGSSLVQTAS